MLEEANRVQRYAPGIRVRTDCHHERVKDEIGNRDAIVGGARNDLARDLESHLGVLHRAALVVAQGNHSRAIFLRQRQYARKCCVFARRRVDQRLAGIDG